eukprot:TRINITY_DN1940_c0_g1_i1.p1 TRINITY_DN1940_c0_g1~~TRINITY_DN1940_c0_g1_i1.p1  ORF type:complete len:987 (-),score=204.53 TRINITY_DN1940_c0_g1_i1:81-3041(-)
MGTAASIKLPEGACSLHEKFVQEFSTNHDSGNGECLSQAKLKEATWCLGFGVTDCVSLQEHLDADRPVSPLQPQSKSCFSKCSKQAVPPLDHGQATSHVLRSVLPLQPKETVSYRTQLRHQKKEALVPKPPTQPRGASSILVKHRHHKEVMQPMPPVHPREQPASRRTQLQRHQKDSSKQVLPHGAPQLKADMPQSPGKLSSQLRQQVLMMRQGCQWANPAVPHDPCQVNHHPLQVADHAGLIEHDTADAAGMLQSEFLAHKAGVMQECSSSKKTENAFLSSILEQAADDGSLQGMLLEIKNEKVQGQWVSGRIPARFANLQMQAVQDSHLEIMLSNMKQETTQQTSNRMQRVPVPAVAASASKLAGSENVSFGPAGQIGKLLLQAVYDGRLESVLSEIKDEAMPDDKNYTKDTIATLLDVLGQAADDGSLESVLIEIKKNQAQWQLDPVGIHERFANLVMQAAQNGSLESILSDVMQETNQRDSDRTQGLTLPLQAAIQGGLASTSKQAESDDASPGSARNAGTLLLEAVHDGRLKSLLSDLREEVGKDCRNSTTQESTEVCNVLAQAAHDGSLESMLLEIKNDQVHGQLDSGRIHERFAILVIQAARNGNLEGILSDVMQESKSQQTSDKIQGVTVLPRAASDGSRASGFKRPESRDISPESRGSVGNLLLQAVHDGRLESVLIDLKEEVGQDGSRTTEAADSKLFDLLGRAADDGSLASILFQIKSDNGEGQHDPVSTLDRAANGSLESITSENRQETAQQASTGAAVLPQIASGGCWNSSLKQGQPGEDLSCRSFGMAGNLLSEAVHDGRLANVLGELKEETIWVGCTSEKDGERHIEHLGQAAANGSLQSMLTEIKEGAEQEQRESVMVSERASHLLVQALHDRRLEGILGELVDERVQDGLDSMQTGNLRCSSQVATYCSRGELVDESGADHSSESCRDRASHLLAQALHDGSLDSVLTELSAATGTRHGALDSPARDAC